MMVAAAVWLAFVIGLGRTLLLVALVAVVVLASKIGLAISLIAILVAEITAVLAAIFICVVVKAFATRVCVHDAAVVELAGARCGCDVRAAVIE